MPALPPPSLRSRVAMLLWPPMVAPLSRRRNGNKRTRLQRQCHSSSIEWHRPVLWHHAESLSPLTLPASRGTMPFNMILHEQRFVNLDLRGCLRRSHERLHPPVALHRPESKRPHLALWYALCHRVLSFSPVSHKTFPHRPPCLREGKAGDRETPCGGGGRRR